MPSNSVMQPVGGAPATRASFNSVTVAVGTDIANVLAAAPAGTTVQFVRGGNYRLTAPLTIPRNGITLAAIGSPSQPLPKLSVASGVAISAATRDGVTLRDLEIVADRATNVGVTFHGCSAVTVQGCRISGFTFAITIEAWPGSGTPLRSRDVVIRGNVIADNYNAAGRSSGLYVDMTDRLTLDGNVFDHNGWSQTVAGAGATPENHNVYLTANCGPSTVTGNVFSRASSHGIQARAGGDVVGNLFIDNPIHMSFGNVNGAGAVHVGGVSGRVSGNVMTGTRSIGNQPRGIGITAGNILSAMIDSNLIADGATGIFQAIQLVPCVLDPANTYVAKGVPQGKPVGILNLSVRNNAIWGWPGGTFLMDPKIHSTSAPGNMFCGKMSIQPTWTPARTADLRALLGADDPKNPASLRFTREGAGNVAAILQILRDAAGLKI